MEETNYPKLIIIGPEDGASPRIMLGEFGFAMTTLPLEELDVPVEEPPPEEPPPDPTPDPTPDPPP